MGKDDLTVCEAFYMIIFSILVIIGALSIVNDVLNPSSTNESGKAVDYHSVTDSFCNHYNMTYYKAITTGKRYCINTINDTTFNKEIIDVGDNSHSYWTFNNGGD